MENGMVVYFVIMVVLCFGMLIAQAVSRSMTRSKIRQLAESTLEVTPEEFFKIRNQKEMGKHGKHISTTKEFSGVYIIYNQTQDLYYVGQAKKIFKRVNDHFTGHGNGDVYADYKYGNKFTIRMVALDRSGCSSLNELERKMIDAYDAKNKGYNKTKGNRG